YEGESAYNYIQVQEHTPTGYRFLFLNEGQGIHSQWHPDIITYDRTWSYFLTAPYFNAPSYAPEQVKSVAVVGLAAGTIPRQHIEIYGNINIDGIEIDPEITQVGADYFQMNTLEMPQLNVIVGDGRYELNQSENRYDVVALDAYRPPYIPWHLTTVEFFEEIQQRLTPDGVVAINVGRTPGDRRLVNAMTSTLSAVYPSVHTMDVPNTFNTILVATQQPTSADNLALNTAQIDGAQYPLLVDMLEKGSSNIVPTVADGPVFTDDKAPVELLVDSIVLNFLFSGDADSLR
ncbi:MAG: fused MFS/spermidine synthase, partial [Chloroflexota bacterium]